MKPARREMAEPRGPFLLALLPALLLACGGEQAPRSPAPAAPAPDEASEREFRAVCRALKESNEPYYGEQRLVRLSAWFESARAGGAAGADPEATERRLLKLGSDLLEAGRADEALAVLEGDPLPGFPRGAGSRAAAAPLPGVEPEEELVEAGSETAAAPFPGRLARGDSSDPSPRIRRLALARNAHLQAGEDENCVLRHTAASCILPLRDDAIHTLPDHARRAGDLSLAILELRPNSISARWLLNLARMVSGDYPEGVPEALRLPADAFGEDADFPWWPDRAPELGVDALDLAGGAVVDDFDGDGLLDLVSSTADPCDSLKAFRSDGRGGFEDVTRAWGLQTQLGGLNLVHADYDGDGRLDLLVLRGGWLGAHGEIRNSLLHNELDADGGFVDATRSAGLAALAAPSQTAAFSDYDGDGDLDLYIGNEAVPERPYPSQLFRNEGGGRFRDVSAAAGVENLRFAKGVAWGDMDDDGDPDLYVSNIGPNRLYRNEGDGRFRDVAAELGVERPRGRSFATWFFDYDNDGRLDIFVADYGAFADEVMASYFGSGPATGHPLVYHNEGGGFREVSAQLGLMRPLLPMGANYGDLDGDGWPDIYLGTGNPRFEVLVPNVMLRNRKGERFSDVSFAGGFAHLQKGHGVAFADVDNDGDQDLFHQLGGFYPGDAYGNALFENPGFGAHWITLRLEGRQANRFGVGARIEVRVRDAEGSRSVHALTGSGGSFGGSSLQQEIGLGAARAIEEIRIRWPGSDTRQRLHGVELDRAYRVVEGRAEPVVLELPRFRLGGRSPARLHSTHANHRGSITPHSAE